MQSSGFHPASSLCVSLYIVLIHSPSPLFVFYFSIESLFVNSSTVKWKGFGASKRRTQISVCHFVFLQRQDWVLFLRSVGRSALFRVCIAAGHWQGILGRNKLYNQVHWVFVGHFREPGSLGQGFRWHNLSWLWICDSAGSSSLELGL